MVDGAASLYDDCEGDLLRFQVLNGSLWVQHITERWAGMLGGAGEGSAAAWVPWPQQAGSLFSGQGASSGV